MSAESLTTAVTLFANPSTPLQRAPLVNQSIPFRFILDGTIQTLSTNNSPDQGSVKGLLFVPTLDIQDPCNNATAPFIPWNVTRKSNLPDLGYDLIGLAPWISINCTQSYLAASRSTPARGLIFYRPGSHDTGKPPPVSDPVWTMDDGGVWKKDNPYPVYAIPGPAGATLMHELALYSGNMTSPGDGTNNLTGVSQPIGYARLYALIDLEKSGSALPSLWVFILAILGILLFIIMSSILTIRLIQSKRRENLRRRIEAGEVDLESLGIKRMNVPPDVLDQIPLYTYPVLAAPPKAVLSDEQTLTGTLGEEDDIGSAIAPAMMRRSDADMSSTTLKDPDILTIEIATVRESSASIMDSKKEAHLTFCQPTCAICLDDFVPGSSTVRELPCAHIFHPQCVDTFLMQNSSLCPVCKKSVLPPDFCPDRVTNLMVRRERLLRRAHRLHENEIRRNARLETSNSMSQIWMHPPAADSFIFFSGSTPSLAEMPNYSTTDLRATVPSPLITHSVPDEPNHSARPSSDVPASQSRQEAMRRRAVAMLGHRGMSEEEEMQREGNLPKWRKVVNKVLGF